VRTACKTAIVHDWLVRPGGAERVLECLLELWPGADLFTLFWVPGSVSQRIESRLKGTSFIQRFTGLKRHYGSYLPLFPKAVESLPLSGYDLVISSSYCAAKGSLAGPGARHLCYCHTPMRYVWHQQHAYERSLSPLARAVFRRLAARLRAWDVATSKRPDAYAANSRNVAGRIREYYGLGAEVIHPPVDTGYFTPGLQDEEGDYYLTVGALVPYKNYEAAISAFSRSGRRLLVVGDGPEKGRLKNMAGPSVEFLGWQPHEKLLGLYRGCRGLVSPGEEDFGISMVEAQSCGRPVIALAKGGALESVVDGRTGILYSEPDAGTLVRALEKTEKTNYNRKAVRSNADRFSVAMFSAGIASAANRLMGGMVHAS